MKANKKLRTLSQIAKAAAAARKAGKKVGLITGCFDVLHAGRVGLFRFAKKHCNYVIVGLDSDKTVRLNKGPDRPLHNISQRERVLGELESVDLIFEVKGKFHWATEQAEKTYERILLQIKPDYLITNPVADRFWKLKEQRAHKIGARLLKDVRKKALSTTRIIKFFAGEL